MEKIPRRIVSLAPSTTEILFALGLADRVVGVTGYCNYPEEAKDKEIIEGFATPDIEKVISLKPDLVLAFGTLQKPLVKKLEERGLNVSWIYPHTFDEILESFEKIGELTSSSIAAKKLRNTVERRVKNVYEKVRAVPEQERPGVFRVMSLNPIGTIGGEAFQTNIYRLAGGKNIFADVKQDYFEVDIEALLKLDPDIIVVAGWGETETRAKIGKLKGWENLTAIKTGGIVVIPAELICRPGPRIGLTIETLAKEFHPDLFR